MRSCAGCTTRRRRSPIACRRARSADAQPAPDEADEVPTAEVPGGAQQAPRRRRVEGEQAPMLAALRHPQRLEGVVAAAEIDLADAVDVEYVLDHAPGQQRADRARLEVLVVGELAQGCAAVPDDPDLRRGRLLADMDEPEAQATECGAGPDEGCGEIRVGLADLPAPAVHPPLIPNHGIEHAGP